MSSRVYIANRALTKLGQARIISLSDNGRAASTIDSMYDGVLAALLRANVWAFAKARARLPALSSAPAFGFLRQFQLPPDWLRLLKVANFVVYPAPRVTDLFSIEGRKILIDLDGPLNIEYIRLVTDPTEYDPLFTEVFATRLAVEACEDITDSETKFQRMTAMHKQALADALRANAMERPAMAIQEDSWLDVRR